MCLYSSLAGAAPKGGAGEGGVPPGSEEAPKLLTNRLGKEKSPYLLQHSSNPVDW